MVLIARLAQIISAYVRFLTTVNSTKDQQRFWIKDNSFWSRVKKHLLVAPLVHKRHNKEIQLSSAINVGTLPSRLHTLFLAFYILTNLLYCCLLDFHNQSRASLLAEARGRTGHLSVMNMMPLFLFSARNNPFIPILGISFDTFNLFHRWIGRIVVIEGIAHTFLWGANNYAALGLHGLLDHLWSDLFLVYGFIATVAMVAILFQSVSIVRHAFYECFLHLHQFLAMAALVGTLLHCEAEVLPQRPLLYTVICVWGAERLIRIWRIFSRRGAKVRIEALEGGACRVTFDIRGSWPKGPGHHIYAYIPALSLWMSHPFSVAWVDRHTSRSGCSNPTLSNVETLTPSPSNDSGVAVRGRSKNTRTSISCIVAARSGMTAALFRKACRSPISLSAFVEGPYGGLENMRSYGTVLLFAGGVGITHQLSHVHDIVSAWSEGACSTRKIILIWTVRSVEQLEWVRPYMDELLEMPTWGNSLKMSFYVTRSSIKDDHTALKEMGFSQQIKFGRMVVRRLVEEEFRERVGAMSIGVCGPGGLADDVRAFARSVMGRGKVDFWEEAFTW